MGTHSGRRRSDVFFESTVAKQIALIESGLQEKKIYVGNLDSLRTFQDARDAVRAYYLLLDALDKKTFQRGECFNIAGDEIFQLKEIIDILLEFSTVSDIKIEQDPDRLRPLDADYQLFDNSKIKNTIDWKPELSVRDMLLDLLNHWRDQISKGNIPLSR